MRDIGTANAATDSFLAAFEEWEWQNGRRGRTLRQRMEAFTRTLWTPEREELEYDGGQWQANRDRPMPGIQMIDVTKLAAEEAAAEEENAEYQS